MTQAQIQASIEVIRNETAINGNTKTRVADVLTCLNGNIPAINTSQDNKFIPYTATLADLGVTKHSEVTATIVASYIASLNLTISETELLLLDITDNPIILFLNRFEYTTGNVPDQSTFESRLGFAMVNSLLNNNAWTFDNTLYNLGSNSFYGAQLSNVISSGTIFGDSCFKGCTLATTFNFPLATTFGSGCFGRISGNTITVTLPIAFQTSNGGNLDAQLQILSDNNTVTFNWV